MRIMQLFHLNLQIWEWWNYTIKSVLNLTHLYKFPVMWLNERLSATFWLHYLQSRDFIKSHLDVKPTRSLTFSYHNKVKMDKSWFKWPFQGKDDIWYHLRAVRKWQEVTYSWQMLTWEKFEIISARLRV